MKIKSLRVLVLSVVAGGFVSGCVIEPHGRVAFRPVVVVEPPPPVYVAPPPPVEVDPVMIPDSYTWDGYEYVGVVGDQYYYLGPGNVWMFCEPFRLERFHGWERGHGDWRSHAIRNDRYRTDRNGHAHPRGEVRGKDRREDHH